VPKVIDIGEFRMTLKSSSSWSPETCKHSRITMDDHGDIVTCDDCKQPVSAYWFIKDFFQRYEEYRTRVEHRAKQVEESEKKNLILRAAQRVETAWRSRRMVPVCPHCRNGIFPEDGLGNSLISKDLAVERKKEKRA